MSSLLLLLFAAAAAPVPIAGPTATVALPLTPGKPAGLATGVQVVAPVDAWRIGVEAFMSTPATGFSPALGGDVAFGRATKAGLVGSIAAYGRYTVETSAGPSSAQFGPGLVFGQKLAPTLLMMVPLVLWVDAETGSATPTLATKVLFGVPSDG